MAVRQIAQPFDSYDGLVAVVRHRLAEVASTCEAVSDLAGLTTTHVSKLVNPKRSRILGRISLTVLLQVLGLKLVAVVDEEAFVPIGARLPKAKFNRWKLPSMKISVGELGGLPAIERVPPLREAAVAKPRRRGPPRPSEGLAGAI
jgi:hypothetical protein